MNSISFSLLLLVFSWTNAEVIWPSGTYGLPKAETGCPEGGVTWSEGWWKQDMEDTGISRSEISSNSHMDAKFVGDKKDINRTFCMKTRPGNSKKLWPKGFYCVYKNKGSLCPDGMKSGHVKWDDEDMNKNSGRGTLPDGEYGEDTIIFYCCQSQGSWHDSLELPIDHPFYLLPCKSESFNSPRCQQVKWALSKLEYIIYDTQDGRNGDALFGNHVFAIKSHPSLLTVYYCYYESCRYKMTGNNGSFTSINRNNSHAYPDFQYCSWLVSVSEGLVVSLNFTYLLMPNCQENYIDIYDGVTETSSLLVRYCGSNATTGNERIVSSRNSVYLILKSGNNSQNRDIPLGFQAEYRAEVKRTGCSYKMTGNNGSFTLSKQDLSYIHGDFKYCSWLVTVNETLVVLLHFPYLQLPNCQENFINIYDGKNETYSLLASYCGSNATEGRKEMVSTTNSVYVFLKYRSSSKNAEISMAFRAEYSSLVKPTKRTTVEKTNSPSITTLPNTTLPNTRTGLPVTSVIIPVIAGVAILILIVVMTIIYKRRKRRQGATSPNLFRSLNPSYDQRKMATVLNRTDSQCYATPTSPEEKLWLESSTICKEGQNPIYQPGDKTDPSDLYRSTDNITYEPALNQKEESKQSLYDSPFARRSPVYTEPTTSKSETYYNLPKT